jgi:hypothetical protein
VDLAVALLTWNLVGGTLFVFLPSDPVEEVCVNDEVCVVPDNRVVILLDWDGPPPVVRARSGQTWMYAVPCPPYAG